VVIFNLFAAQQLVDDLERSLVRRTLVIAWFWISLFVVNVTFGLPHKVANLASEDKESEGRTHKCDIVSKSKFCCMERS
jgi:hypothetical protein